MKHQRLGIALLGVCMTTAVAWAAPPVPGKAAPVVTYDAERCCLLVNGQPFFAIGCYGVLPDYMAECATAGFNLTTHTLLGTDPARVLKEAVAKGPAAARDFIRAYPDAAQRAGLWSLENPLSYSSSLSYGQWGAHGTPAFESHLTEFMSDIFPVVVDNVRGHPAVLGLMGWDEPGEGWSDTLGAYYRAVKDRDSSRRTVVNFAYVVQELPGILDVATVDYYPVRGQTPLIRVCESVRASAERARRMGAPCWFVPLVESFDQGPALGPEDQVAQTYLAIVGGATGIVWWAWPPLHADTWAVLKRLAGELRTLAPVLTEQTKQPEVSLATPELQQTVQARVIRHGPVTYVIAVNAVPTAVDAEFRLPQPLAGKATVWFENRTIALNQGKWRDHFAGLERHVYAVQTSWPGEAPLQLALALSPMRAPESAAAPPVIPGNLLSDPGFEADDVWLARVFPTDQPGNEGRRCFLDTEVRHSGGRSGAIEFTDAGKGAAWDSPHVRLQPNTLYRYGIWARMESAGAHHSAAIMTLATSTDNWPSRCYATVLNYAGWQEYSNLVWSGPDGNEVWMRCTYAGENIFEEPWTRGSGRVWYDDAYIVPAPEGIRNVLANGGFEGEEWLRDWPAGWVPMFSLIGRPGTVGGPQPLWGLDHTVAWEGKASMRLVNPGPTTAEDMGLANRLVDANQFLRGMALTAGKTYTLSAYMKADRPGLPVVVISGGWMSCETIRVTDTWQRYTLKCAPTATIKTRGFIGFQTREPGTLWIDGVQFEEGATPTPFRSWR
jgi:hypothetical protein